MSWSCMSEEEGGNGEDVPFLCFSEEENALVRVKGEK